MGKMVSVMLTHVLVPLVGQWRAEEEMKLYRELLGKQLIAQSCRNVGGWHLFEVYSTISIYKELANVLEYLEEKCTSLSSRIQYYI